MYFGCISQYQGERGGERERGRERYSKGRMIKRSLRTASVLRYSTRTKHYKLNRIWAFGIRKRLCHTKHKRRGEMIPDVTYWEVGLKVQKKCYVLFEWPLIS
jgi:hypothetical protein